MKILNQSESFFLDQETTRLYKIPSIILMENAGIQCALKIAQILKKVIKKKSFIVLAGPGNNAGDALVIARFLYNFFNINSKIFLSVDKKKMSQNALLQLEILEKLCFSIEKIENLNQLEKYFSDYTYREFVIIDGLFGVGIQRKVEGIFFNLIEYINKLKKLYKEKVSIFSIDNPSGLIYSTEKQDENSIIQADHTLCIEVLKTPLMSFPGFEKAGKIHLIKIGFPKKLIQSIDCQKRILSFKKLSTFLPKRKRNTHKGDYGHLLIIGGSLKYPGSILLSSEAALFSGVGKISLLSDDLVCKMAISKNPELMPIFKSQFLSNKDFFRWFKSESKNYTSILFGPGLGRFKKDIALLKCLIYHFKKPIIIDADGLWVFKKLIESDLYFQNLLKKRKIILTPHIKEMSLLLGLNDLEWTYKKSETCLEFIKKNPSSILLKSAISEIFFKNSLLTIYNIFGNQGMAKGGSGDVLSGILSALTAQGISCKKALCLAAFLHGYSGNIALLKKSDYTLTPSDIIKNLDYSLKKII